jgi:sugar phosphate isomerase/epimerase
MTVALTSSWRPEAADRLAEAARLAHGMGFRAVYAARPPADVKEAREVLEGLDVTLAAVGTDRVHDATAIPAAVERAAEAASALRRPLVALDLFDLVAGPRESADAAVVRLCRVLHETLSAWPGLGIAVRATGRKDLLVGWREAEWLLDDLSGKAVGLWFDPVRALALERAGAGPAPLDWAARHGRRVLGVTLARGSTGGPGDGGHAPPEAVGLDWGTLRDLVPSRAARVLDVGPSVPAPDVVDARRYLEEVLGW